MKKVISLLLVLAMMILLCACDKKMDSVDDLIKQARKELPIENSKDAYVEYAGLCGVDNSVLFWMMAPDMLLDMYYLPMECTVHEDGTYTFEKSYTATNLGNDIALLSWHGGCSFLINNPKCAKVRISDGSRTLQYTIPADSIPYVFFTDTLPAEFVFLDSYGNEI